MAPTAANEPYLSSALDLAPSAVSGLIQRMEALDWDMSDDELPADVTDLVALVD